jgi:hypothetical protein
MSKNKSRVATVSNHSVKASTLLVIISILILVLMVMHNTNLMSKKEVRLDQKSQLTVTGDLQKEKP